MSYGVFQEYFSTNWTLQRNQDLTGIIGTTFNGVIYLAMPFLFAALSHRRRPRLRTAVALLGAALLCTSLAASSLSRSAAHLVATQGVLAPLGCALVYSPTTLALGEQFDKTTTTTTTTGTGRNRRAAAYGVVLSCKNVVGSVCPFLLRALLDRYGFRAALRVWAAIVACTSVPAVLFLIHPFAQQRQQHPRTPRTDSDHSSPASTPSSPGEDTPPSGSPWRFLRHKTIYVYGAAIALQSSGYGIPQTYLGAYAHDAALLSQTSATLLLTIFNLPGIVASTFFGYLSDRTTAAVTVTGNSRYRRLLPSSLAASTVTSIPALGAALAAFLFWGLAPRGSMALLVLFSVTFGFFAGGYSATWGGVLAELEREAAAAGEAVDPGVLYGLLNGARGVGYVSGGLVGVPLLKAGGLGSGGVNNNNVGYGTTYGPLIIFTGLSSVLGGWAVLWRLERLLPLVGGLC